jgi:hypothetical protein
MIRKVKIVAIIKKIIPEFWVPMNSMESAWLKIITCILLYNKYRMNVDIAIHKIIKIILMAMASLSLLLINDLNLFHTFL